MSDRDAGGSGQINSARARVALIVTTSVALLVTRYPLLEKGLWEDEIFTAAVYVRGGPSTIWDSDAFIPNNHPLFSLLTWLSTFGSASEAVLRIWSVVPGIVGVLLLTWYAARHWSLTAAVLIAALLVSHDLHQSLVTQARGYGLAFAAGCAAVVAADSVLRDPERGRHSTALAIAGFAGTATLVVFIVPVAVTWALLILLQHGHRRELALKAALMLVAIGGWWLPLVDGVVQHSSQEFGERLPFHGLITGWLDHAGATLLGDPVAYPEPLLLIVRAGFATLVGCTIVVWSRRGQVGRTAIIVGPLVGSYAVLTVGRFFVEPRFNFHLLPYFVAAITVGPAKVIEGWRPSQKRLALAAAAPLLAVLLVERLREAGEATPREAFSEVAAVIDGERSGTPILTNSVRPLGFRYYLDRPVVALAGDVIEKQVCADHLPVTVIDHPFKTTSLKFPCDRAAEARSVTVFQQTRGEYMRVWFFPERSRQPPERSAGG